MRCRQFQTPAAGVFVLAAFVLLARPAATPPRGVRLEPVQRRHLVQRRQLPSGTRLRLTGSGLRQLSRAATIAEPGGAPALGIDRGPVAVPSAPTGPTVLSGSNTFTGGVRLVSGNLVLGSAGALGTRTFTVDGA